MTAEETLNFPHQDVLGRVFRVDTSSVWAEATDHERIATISVGSLVAFQGASATEFLIGLLDRVTRDLHEDEQPSLDRDDDDTILLQSRERDVMRVVLLGTYRTVEGVERNTFKRGADSYPHIGSSAWVIESRNLQLLMGLLSKRLDAEKRLELGAFVADPSARAIADGDRLFQRHAALLGSTGSGKSWSVALILERAKALAHPNLIVFDMHGEYAPLTDGEEPVGRGFKVAGPGQEEGDEGALYLPWWVLNQEEMQALLLDRSEQNAPNQASRLLHHVRALKHEALVAAGRSELADRFTVDSPIPFPMDELIDRLEADDTEMVEGRNAPKAGPFNGKLTRFITRLKARRDDRRFSFMFSPPDSASEYEWLHGFARGLLSTKQGIKVIDFSEVPSDVLPIVAGVLARLLYQIRFWAVEEQRTPVTLVCDEAHLYLPAGAADVAEQRALDSFERIAKEGRKYGVSLLVVSQRPADVSKTVLSQCNNFIVLRLTNDQDQAVVRRLMPDSMEGLTASLPMLDVGEALLLGDALVLPTRIRLDPPKIKPASATKNFWTEWNTIAADEDELIVAVEALRKQSR